VIDYRLSFDDGRIVEFAVDPERQPAAVGAEEHPFWTQLDYHQCPNCPLARGAGGHCPAALDIEGIVTAFRDVVSYRELNVEVRTPDRTYVKRTDVQTALRSLMGLTLATGGCPLLGQMKGPARLHMPFATMEETLFRMVGSYLLGQFLVGQGGGRPDWELRGLSRLYLEIQEVNFALKRRLDAAAEKDANINAVVMLTGIAMLVSCSLEQQLAELAPFAMGTGNAGVPP
jgi:hypothetical protein